MSSRLTLLIAVVALLAGCGDSTTTSDIPSGEETTPPASATTEAAEKAPAGCKSVEEPEAKPDGALEKPAARLDASKTYSAVVKTNCGSFEFELDAEKAPNTAASIDYLARQRFYDGTLFHRIVPDFVIQGGDPTGSGSGGPGYKTVDKPPASSRYTTGVVAMAKGGDEPAGTAGSQFFVVTGADAGLPADYAVVGRVTKGMDVVQRIGKLGDSAEQPTFPVVIESFSVDQR